MYVVFWKRGNRPPDLRFTPSAYCPRCNCYVAAIQSWKNPVKRWGRYGKNRQYLYRCPTCAGEVMPDYYCAANAIDWSLPSERIGDRKKPLKEKTLERIKVGLEKYGRQPMLLGIYGPQGQRRAVRLDLSVPTLTGTPTFGLVHPGFLVDLGHTHAEHPGKCHNIYDPIPTQTSRQTLAFVVSMRDAPDYPLKHITEPLPTQSTVGAPYLVELYGQSDAKSLNDPLGTILTNTHSGLVQPYLIEMHGSGTQARPLTDALGCVLAGGNHHGLVTPQPFLVSYYSGSEQAKNSEPTVEDCYFRMLKSHEIGKAMAFPESYVVTGNERERIKQYGNAVTPPVMTMILERCAETFK